MAIACNGSTSERKAMASSRNDSARTASTTTGSWPEISRARSRFNAGT